MKPNSRLHARAGLENVSGAASSTTDRKFYAIMKGDTTAPTITAMEDENGVAVSAGVLNFINNELPTGVWLPIPCQNVTLSVGELLLAIDQKE